MEKLILYTVIITNFFAPLTVIAQAGEGIQYSMEAVSNGKIYKITQKNKDYTFDSARYTVFIPDGISNLKAVFIHQHGCTMEGRGASSAYDLQYQAFAKNWKLAIVGPDLYSDKNNCHDWRNPESGSGAALIKTLKELGKVSRYKDLEDLPWLLWGHSGGGYWTLSMLINYPERVLAVFGYSPAFEPGAYPRAALKVPVFMRHAGLVGDACCWQTSIREFGKLRSQGGYAAIVYTGYQSHNYSFVRYMAIPFFEAVMKQRLSGRSCYRSMKDMNGSGAWLGDTLSLNIFKEKDYRGNKLAAAWLPDSATAYKWREYAMTGTVVDRTPPPAPRDLKINRQDNGSFELSWKADADIESGISYFNIYKDDQPILRFPQYGSYQQFDTNGDDSYPIHLPDLKTIISLQENDIGKLSVTTVNHFGLESKKAIISVKK